MVIFLSKGRKCGGLFPFFMNTGGRLDCLLEGELDESVSGVINA
jgi:hypothetical protein